MPKNFPVRKRNKRCLHKTMKALKSLIKAAKSQVAKSQVAKSQVKANQVLAVPAVLRVNQAIKAIDLKFLMYTQMMIRISIF